MHESLCADQLLSAAEAVRTSFDGIPRGPVALDGAASASRRSARIVERYERHGFAVFDLGSETVTPQTVSTLTASLGVGEPFVPDLYRRNGANPASVAQISASANAGTADAGHPSFGRTDGQELHCDGTLQPLGFIKASVLLCESPADSGGETILFNTSAAIAELAAADPAAVLALAVPGVLVRQANLNGSSELNVGAAVTVEKERLVCGYSVTATDRWEVPEAVSRADLERGVEFLRSSAIPGSPYFTDLTLRSGQGIVFDNTRISHGRRPYRDSAVRKRRLYRSLHLDHPRVSPEADSRRGIATPLD
ncbi:TauD/TfdA family dioxygenase [Nocardia takedensis]